MITLIDLGHAFWRNFYGMGSAVGAYEQTIEQCEFYFRDCPRTALCCEGRNPLRKQWFEGYKAHRPDKPEEALESLVAVGQQVASWGMPVVSADGFEADDVIATLTKQAWIEDVQILSNDKDLYQLLSPTVRLIGTRHVGVAECVAKFGVQPCQMRDWLAMVGDAADAVPGCPHCGPGRARDLLQKFETLEAVRAAKDEDILSVRGVGKKTLEALRAWDPSLAVRLVTLLTDAPVEIETLWSTKAA